MIMIDGIPQPVEIIRSRRKTLTIQVSSNGDISVRSPLGLSDGEIEKFLREKSGWIKRQIEKIAENNKKIASAEPFTAEEIKEMVDIAMLIIPRRVAYFAPIIGVSYGRITIRNQKTRWGSCSSNGNLNFNCLLVKTPPDVLDSVVVHELCHRKHMDHSKDFYAEVYRVFPDYDRCSRWLKENGAVLIRRMIQSSQQTR